jgi:hypothetical protein
MKKIYSAVLIALCINSISNAQSAFLVENTSGINITNTTVNVSVDYFDQVSYIMDVKNISNVAKGVKMRKDILSDLTGSNITMCTGTNCLSPSVVTTPTAVILNPNATLLAQNEEYHAVFQPFGNLGGAVVKYTIFEDGGNDSVFVLFNFNSQILSVKNINTYKNLNIAFADKQLQIENEAAKNYTLEVFNLTGKKIESIVNNNSVNTSISLPSNQIYLVRYKIDNKIYTKKIIAN